MNAEYKLHDEAEHCSPALVVYPAIIAPNIRAAIAAAGGPDRLRPHAKTHKTAEIAQMLMLAGVTRHKCATIAEAEMLAEAGAADVLIAYPLIGPNLPRLIALKKKFPGTHFSSLIDHPANAAALSAAAAAAGTTCEFILDLEIGQQRTGIAPDQAVALYTQAAAMPGLVPGGLQAYDGHNRHEARAERERTVRDWLGPVLEVRAALERKGLPVPRIVAGGTPSFPITATLTEVPGLECSPGTFVLHDNGYGSRYPDIAGVVPAAVLLTRVVSRPTATRVTLDLGTKAVASDPPLAQRFKLLDFPPYELAGQNEEHLIVETKDAGRFTPGDVAYALPGHVCPTVALYAELLVAEGNRVVGTWRVRARDRRLTI